MAMESSNRVLGLFLVTIFMLILGSSASSRTKPYTFYVGGKDGWVVKPSEDYSHWAQRNRFRVNDTLYFKYEKGSDSVLVVKKEDYDSCNLKNPIKKMDDGDSKFVVDKSGPFFFISGNVENCKRGQKLNVVVLGLTHHKHSHSPPSAAPPSVPPSAPRSPAAEAESPAKMNAPSPAKHSGSTRVRVSGGVAFGVSVGMSLFFSVLG